MVDWATGTLAMTRTQLSTLVILQIDSHIRVSHLQSAVTVMALLQTTQNGRFIVSIMWIAKLCA